MINDKFIAQYVGALKQSISDVKDALANGRHDDLYSVGRLQGHVDGLKSALELLEADLEAMDV